MAQLLKLANSLRKSLKDSVEEQSMVFFFCIVRLVWIIESLH